MTTEETEALPSQKQEILGGDFQPVSSREDQLFQKAEVALRENMIRFQLAVQGSQDGIWDAQLREGQFWESPQTEVYYSSRFKELLGFQDHEMPNVLNSWSERLHPEDRDRVFQALRDHLEQKAPYDVDYRLQHKSGEYRWFSARGQAVWDSSGHPCRMAGTLRDITHRKRDVEALRLQERAMAASTCGITIVDALQDDFPIVYVNPAFERTFGYSAAEVKGRNPRFLHGSDSQQEEMPSLKSAIKKGQAYRAILRNYRKDGSMLWNDLTVSPVHDENHRVTHYIGIQNNISDRIRAQQETQGHERLYRSLLENNYSIIIIVDRTGNLQYGSPSIERILGYAPEEFLNKSFFQFVHPADLQDVRETFQQILNQTGSIPLKEFRFSNKSGAWHIWEAIGRNLQDDLSANGVVINARDVTERKRWQRLITQAEKMAAVGQLAAGIAHELNNPLHAILGFAQSISEQVPDADPYAQPLKFIEKEARRCQAVVQNLLTYSRSQKPGIEKVDPVSLVNDILPLIEMQARIKNVILVRNFQSNLPMFLVERTQIQQVLLNLCSNALDSMPDGGVLTISIHSSTHPRHPALKCLRLSVIDTGRGIPPEIKERIFEPFFTTKDVGQGTGLGLSLVYEIIQSHHGEVLVTSEPEKGTTFDVYLPLENHSSEDKEMERS